MQNAPWPKAPQSLGAAWLTPRLGPVAQMLADLGSTDSLDVRRAKALGEIARRDTTLDYAPASVEEVAVRPPRSGLVARLGLVMGPRAFRCAQRARRARPLSEAK